MLNARSSRFAVFSFVSFIAASRRAISSSGVEVVPRITPSKKFFVANTHALPRTVPELTAIPRSMICPWGRVSTAALPSPSDSSSRMFALSIRFASCVLSDLTMSTTACGKRSLALSWITSTPTHFPLTVRGIDRYELYCSSPVLLK